MDLEIGFTIIVSDNNMISKDQEEKVENIIEEGILDSYDDFDAFNNMILYIIDQLESPFDFTYLDRSFLAEEFSFSLGGIKIHVFINNKEFMIELSDITISDFSSRNFLLQQAYIKFLKAFY